jgi:hypothetical protein
VNDEVGRERVLPLETLPAGRTNERSFAGMLGKVLEPTLDKNKTK